MEKRPIRVIAKEIIDVWYENRAKSKLHFAPSQWQNTVYFGAVPYLKAMLELEGDEGMYGADPVSSVVAYGLSNMAQFRGEAARTLKAELKAWL